MRRGPYIWRGVVTQRCWRPASVTLMGNNLNTDVNVNVGDKAIEHNFVVVSPAILL